MTRDSRARLAGLLYLAGLPTAGFAYGYVAFMPREDPAALVTALEAGIQTLRWTVLVGAAGFSLLYLIEVLLFRELLRSAGRLPSDLMVLLVAASVPLALAALARRLDLVALLELPGSAPADAVRTFLQSEASLFQAASLFWGLWLVPLAYLSWRSGLVPRAIAGLLAVAGFGYLWGFAGPLVGATAIMSPIALVLSALTVIGELGFAFWLLVRGARGLGRQEHEPSLPETAHEGQNLPRSVMP